MPGFELSDDNAAAIARICRALDGLPLAIELAAARIRVLGPDGMAQRIGERLALLTRRAPDLAERQRSLRATIEWSVRLLDEPARAAFGAVGVFAAPASLASIERVVGDVVADVPGAMEALLDASLVISEPDSSGEPRFRMLETIRTTRSPTSERAGPSPRRATGTSPTSSTPSVAGTRHDAMTRTIAATSRSSTRSIPTSWRLLRHATATSAVEPEFQLLAVIWRYWRWRGYVEDAHHHLDVATASDDPRVPRLEAANALLGASVIELIRGDLRRAGSHAERAATSYAAVDERLLEAKALVQLASIANASGDPERSLTLCERAAPALRDGGELDILGIALMATAESGRRLGDLERARAAAVEAVELRSSRGNTRGAGFARVVLADIEQRRGEHVAAAHLLRQSLPVGGRAGRSGEPGAEPRSSRLRRSLPSATTTPRRACSELRRRPCGSWASIDSRWSARTTSSPFSRRSARSCPTPRSDAHYDAGLMLGQEEAARLALERLGAFDRRSRCPEHSSRNLRAWSSGCLARWRSGVTTGPRSRSVALVRGRCSRSCCSIPTRRSRPTG